MGNTKMKVFVVLSAVLAVAMAQFECDSCDSLSSRSDRTGCRFFCYSDYFNAGALTRDGIKARFEANRDTDRGMTRGRFVTEMAANIGFCDDESNGLFDVMASIGENDPNLIEEVDIDGLIDLFTIVAGTDVITKDIFAEIYPLMYTFIGNDSCGT